MGEREILLDAFDRVRKGVHALTKGLDQEDLAFRPEADTNSIGWLVWHLTRVQDDHVSEIVGKEQAWISEGWHEKFGMPPEPSNTGFGHTSEQVAAVRPESRQLLLGYYEAVAARTTEYLATVDDEELQRIIDRSYDPPVSVGVRLVSVIADDLQHTGQAAFVRGILKRRN